jgi:hypothetical protein
MKDERSPRPLRSKFASSCFCKNVSRRGAKEQREKRIALTLSLLLCAFAGMFGCGCAALRLCVTSCSLKVVVDFERIARD